MINSFLDWHGKQPVWVAVLVTYLIIAVFAVIATIFIVRVSQWLEKEDGLNEKTVIMNCRCVS